MSKEDASATTPRDSNPKGLVERAGRLEAALRNLKCCASMYATGKLWKSAWADPITQPAIERETEKWREKLLAAAEEYYEAAVFYEPTTEISGGEACANTKKGIE